jgi:hypothetical protein
MKPPSNRDVVIAIKLGYTCCSAVYADLGELSPDIHAVTQYPGSLSAHLQHLPFVPALLCCKIRRTFERPQPQVANNNGSDIDDSFEASSSSSSEDSEKPEDEEYLWGYKAQAQQHSMDMRKENAPFLVFAPMRNSKILKREIDYITHFITRLLQHIKTQIKQGGKSRHDSIKISDKQPAKAKENEYYAKVRLPPFLY